MWSAVSASVLLRNVQASSSARTSNGQFLVEVKGESALTSQPVNGPLLKLLKPDLGGWRDMVDVQSMGIVLFLVRGAGELLLLVIDGRPSLWIDSIRVVANHPWQLESIWMFCSTGTGFLST